MTRPNKRLAIVVNGRGAGVVRTTERPVILGMAGSADLQRAQATKDEPTPTPKSEPVEMLKNSATGFVTAFFAVAAALGMFAISLFWPYLLPLAVSIEQVATPHSNLAFMCLGAGTFVFPLMLLLSAINYTALLRHVAPSSSDNSDAIGQTDEIKAWPGWSRRNGRRLKMNDLTQACRRSLQ
jgi:hypothetical protein